MFVVDSLNQLVRIHIVGVLLGNDLAEGVRGEAFFNLDRFSSASSSTSLMKMIQLSSMSFSASISL